MKKTKEEYPDISVRVKAIFIDTIVMIVFMMVVTDIFSMQG